MSEVGIAGGPVGAVRGRQLAAILRLELRKTLLGRRSIPTYLLALMPIPLFGLMAVLPIDEWLSEGIGRAAQIYGIVFETFMLRAVIFFGCVAIFTSLFRGEVLDRSLHYYLLAPTRRELLVVGKYLAGLATTTAVFSAMVVVTYLLLHVPFGATIGFEYFFRGPGLGHLFAYVSVTVLACVGYGSLFLILGLIFKNPILPAGAVLVWELGHFLMPPLLKKASVIHYLKGLLPLPMAEGPFAVLVDPPPVWASVVGLVAFTAVVLVLASWRLRRMEVHYAE